MFYSSSVDNCMCLVNDSYITILMLEYYFINFEIHNLCQIISYITHQYNSFASSDVFLVSK